MTDLTDQLSTALAGRYRLERELGRGEMAAVFIAEDLKYPRRVAIKVLNPELAALLGPERFLLAVALGDGDDQVPEVRGRQADALDPGERAQETGAQPRPGPAPRRPRGYAQVQSVPLIRWLVAEAYEQLGRPDSAAAYFERAIASPPEGGTDFAQVRMASSFAHRRLVLLYARMGRLEEARRHWVAFSATLTRPDPEMAPLVEEARAALASAEGMAKTARR